MPELPSNSGDKPIASRDALMDAFKENDKSVVKDDEAKKPVKEEIKDNEIDKDDDTKDEDTPKDTNDDDLELKEDEEEEEKLDLEDDKEKQEKDEFDTPPKKKAITAKYPTFFEDFPFVEKMLFRDKAYSEMFGSFNDAKEVKAQAEILNSFEQDLLKGDVSEVLRQTKENAPEAFKKLVDNYLPNLAKVDRDAYFHIIGNVTRSIVKEMSKDKSDDMKIAGKLLAQFILNTEDEKDLDLKKLAKDEPKDDELENKKKEFVQKQYNTARNEMQVRVDNILRSTIDSYIDPKNQMSAYVKKNAVRDALAEVHKSIGGDADYRKNLDRLWQRAFSEEFSSSSTDSIRQSYLGKAKGLLNTIIRKTRAEALKDITPSRREIDEDDLEENEREEKPRKRIAAGAPRQESGKIKGDKLKRQPGESMQEYFARD